MTSMNHFQIINAKIFNYISRENHIFEEMIILDIIIVIYTQR